MYSAYVCVHQYLFFCIYVHYLLFLISIQCTKRFMNLKSITKNHIKQCIRSYPNRNVILLQNWYVYNQIGHADTEIKWSKTPYAWLFPKFQSDKSMCCVLGRNITFRLTLHLYYNFIVDNTKKNMILVTTRVWITFSRWPW